MKMWYKNILMQQQITTETMHSRLTAFVDDSAEITEGNFKVQVIHLITDYAFAEVDIWNLTDADAAPVLIPDFAYGSATTTELPTGVAYVLGFETRIMIHQL